ncbi:MAG: TetR/AcrR family transcriptional regulator, partial [Candidatus Limnocylindrales bacterium]
QTSVQDLLDELDASKGAFYHYFDSKEALLVAVVERMTDEALASVLPVAADPALSAPQKLQHFFGGIASWKSARRELVMAILRAWISDDNAVVREKFWRGATRKMAPLLAGIIRQGREEGLFTASDPDEAARVLLSLMHGANDAAVELYVARQAGTASFETIVHTFAAYNEALERILGAPAGSVPIGGVAILREWYA